MAQHTRWITLLLLCCFTWALSGCGDNNNGSTDNPPDVTTASVAGVAQKGPFQPGGSATASRLNADSTSSSENVSTTLTNNGDYDLTEIDWSGPTQIKVSGTYYDEANGNFTSSPETLYALVNVPEEAQANVNVFTHLVAARASHLMNGGAAFANARDQARSELATIMGTGAPPLALNLLKANDHEDDGANLLLFSAALLATGNAATALDDITADFADDGQINGAGVAAFESVQDAALADPNLLSSARTSLQNQYGTTPPKDTDGQPPGWLTDANGPAPEAAFTTDGPLRVGENQTFDASGSTGDGLSYAWDFGDGGTATGATPTHVFEAEGSYTVTLTVTDGDSQTDNASQPLTITAADQTPPPPVADFTVNGDQTSGATLTFNAGSSTGSSLSYSWDFGDGATAAGAQATHVFAAEGSYTVALTVTDSAGQTDTASQSLTIEAVLPAAPTAAFSVAGDAKTGSTLAFDASDSTGTGLSYAWDFGGNGSATGAQTTHVFAAEGSYTVVLTVTDSASQTDTASRNIEITAAGPEAAFSVSGAAQAGQPQTFDASASSGAGLVYHWDFGDGDAGNGAQIAHVYDSADSYTATLTVTGDNGTDSASQSVTIDAAAQQPVAVDGAISGTVTDAAGAPLAGVEVTLVNAQALVGGARGATTDAAGAADLANMPTGVEFVLELQKAGYAAQFVRTIIPDGTTDAVFKAALIERGPAQTWIAVESGGTKTSSDGVSITLPPNALVDSNGNPVAGNVEVSLTPVNVSNDAELAAFPGSFTAYNDAGDRGLMLSYGVAEFHITQGGEELQIAPGKQATLRIPIYVSKHKDGTPVTVGNSIPLWSLDETTGQWIQEGSGTVVADSASPTGLAFEVTVGHLSWYNCDDFANPYRPIPKCTVSSGLPTLELSETCYITGSIVGDSPRNRVTTNIPAAGGVPLPVPSGVDFQLTGFARNGTLAGSVTINGAAGTTGVVDIVLTPADDGAADGQVITLPYDDVGTIDVAGTTDYYQFSGQAGDYVIIYAGPSGGSSLEGLVRLSTATGQTLATSEFPAGSSSGLGGLSAKLPADGDYSIAIEATANVPGGYQLQANVNRATISIDQNLEGALPPDGSSISFVFEGTAGTVIGVQNVHHSGDRGLYFRVLAGSDGTELIRPGLSMAQLPADDLYILEISDSRTPYTTRDFHTAVARIEPPQALPMDSAGRAEVTGNIAVYGERKFYKFTATAGDGVYISLDQPASDALSSFRTELAVYRPAKAPSKAFFELRSAIALDGNASSDDPSHINALGLQLSGDGSPETYLVSIIAYGSTVGTELGAYTLRVDTAPHGDTIVVDDDLAQCPNADTHSVHAAAFAVSDGGTIDVCAGRYAEHTDINPAADNMAIHIVGRNRATVILSTDEPDFPIFGYQDSSSFSLENLTLQRRVADTGYVTTAYLGSSSNVTVEAAPGTSGLGRLIINVDGAVLDGLEIHGTVLRISANDTVIRNSNITSTGTGGARAFSIDWHDSNNALFENNTVTFKKDGNIDFREAGGFRMLNNDITLTDVVSSNINYHDPLIFIADDGTGATSAIVRGNTITTAGAGLSINLTNASSRAVVEQNLFRFTGPNGGKAVRLYTRHQVAGSALLRNNVFDGVSGFHGGAMSIDVTQNFTDIDIINNTWRAISPDPDELPSSSCNDCGMLSISRAEQQLTGALPVRFINNIIVGWAPSSTTPVFAVDMPPGTTIDSNDNLFYQFDSIYADGGTSTGSGDITGDPLFVNNLLEIDGLSPAVNAGQAPMAGGAPIPDKDYDGTLRPQGANYDIGAHEWEAP